MLTTNNVHKKTLITMKTLLYILSVILLISSCNNARKSTESERGFAEVNGTKLWYEVTGSGDPIVFIHGNFGDHRHWDFQIEPLSKDFKIIRYDVRGYGKSAIPDSVEYYRDCDDLKALMDYLEIDRANICGVSMGSGIAVDFALAYPEYCISLIPIGPWANGYGSGQYRTKVSDSLFQIFGKVFELISSKGPKEATDYWWTGNNEIKNTVVKQRTLDSLLIMGYEYSWWGFLNPNGRESVTPPAMEVLSTIKSPTLIVTAENDIEACKEVADLMHNQIDNSQMISINSAGHLMNMDNPEEFNRVISDFIHSLEK